MEFTSNQLSVLNQAYKKECQNVIQRKQFFISRVIIYGCSVNIILILGKAEGGRGFCYLRAIAKLVRLDYRS